MFLPRWTCRFPPNGRYVRIFGAPLPFLDGAPRLTRRARRNERKTHPDKMAVSHLGWNKETRMKSNIFEALEGRRRSRDRKQWYKVMNSCIYENGPTSSRTAWIDTPYPALRRTIFPKLKANKVRDGLRQIGQSRHSHS